MVANFEKVLKVFIMSTLENNLEEQKNQFQGQKQ
jgi:hypothetical protein